jgi:hypothetical protein
MPNPTPTTDDDDLDELPPLDGETERDEDPDYSDLVDDRARDGSDDPFDDRTAEDDPVDDEDLDTGGAESGWLDDAQDAENLDIGATEIATFEEEAAIDDADEPGVGEEDYGFGDDDSKTDLDGGEEGPLAADEELREQDLPQLDADEEGDVEDMDLGEPAFEPDAGVTWAKRVWTPALAPIDVGRVSAIACAARGAIVAVGASLTHVDLEGGAEPLVALGLDGEVKSIAAGAAAILALTTDGSLFVSTDGATTFARVAAQVRDAALSLGVIWTLTSARTLRRSRDLGATWEDAPGHGAADAICATEAGAIASLESCAIVRGPEGPLAVPDAPAAWPDAPTLAARGRFTACVGARKVRIHDGAAWRSFDAPGAVAATFLDDLGALVYATYKDAEDASWITRVDESGANVVAEINATRDDDDTDGKVTAMARDDARGVLWVAGGFGVIAFELP